MYVEDNSDKIVREAKRKAYGPCNRHKGHINWDDVLGTSFVAFLIGIFALLVATGVSYEHGVKVGSQSAQMEYIPSGSNTIGQISNPKTTLSCYDGKLDNVDTVITLTSGMSFTLSQEHCTVSMQ